MGFFNLSMNNIISCHIITKTIMCTGLGTCWKMITRKEWDAPLENDYIERVAIEHTHS